MTAEEWADIRAHLATNLDEGWLDRQFLAVQDIADPDARQRAFFETWKVCPVEVTRQDGTRYRAFIHLYRLHNDLFPPEYTLDDGRKVMHVPGPADQIPLYTDEHPLIVTWCDPERVRHVRLVEHKAGRQGT